MTTPDGSLCFVDTNVLLYAVDDREPTKQQVACALIERLSKTQTGVLSTQVLIELFHNLTRKFKVSRHTAATLVAAYAQWPVVGSDTELVIRASARSAAQDVSIWDAMVIEAAARAGASILYTEDLNHNQRYGSVTVVNPFV